MEFAIWSTLVGVLLIVMALSATVLARLPLSTALLYLLTGVAVSPIGFGLVAAGPHQHTVLLEHVTEIVVVVSLFTAGLKLSAGLSDRSWLLPLRLALSVMLITVTAIAALGYFLLDLSPGAAILLGAILAPTDPVLASDVQVTQPGDRDRLRFALTGEGGLNDGTAFPFVMLGLGLLGLHEMGAGGWRWVAVDVVWATAAGLCVGAYSGVVVARLALYLRREHQRAAGLDDFLALGLIGVSYGVAVLLHAYGFLAVFAAGVALRHLDQSQAGEPPNPAVNSIMQAALDAPKTLAQVATAGDEGAPARMSQALLRFNEQLDRIGEVAIVITIGALLWAVEWDFARWWFVVLLLLVVRPVAVAVGLLGSRSSGHQRWLIGWFGIRGVGSLYYLMFAINQGMDAELAATLTALTLSVVVTSVVVHGISVTPLMAAYEKRHQR
jgi:NhaP-type Na+/H+ or K+/H+ antiporter